MSKNLNEELKTLFESYSKKIPLKMQEINEAWQNLQNNWSEENLTKLQFFVHKLHGSAGIYGFEQLSKVAGQLENYLTQNGQELKATNLETDTVNQFITEMQKYMTSTDQAIPTHVPENTQNKINNFLIYILDDGSHSWIKPLTEKMNRYGYEIERFRSIQGLFDKLKHQQPMVIFADFDMLDNPFEINLEDKSIQEMVNTYFSKIPVLFFSNYDDFHRRLRAVRLCGKSFLVPPFQVNELVTEIESLKQLSNEPIKVMILDDDLQAAEYYAKILLSENIENKILTSPVNIKNDLHQFQPDAILIDLNMPECSGIEVASIIRQQKMYEDLPIIYLSVEENKSKQLAAMSVGVDDFISKSTELPYLIQTVKNKANRYKKLKLILIKDNLTGGFNFRYMTSQIEKQISEFSTNKKALTICITKIDNLTQINKSYGYAAGNQLLRGLFFLLSSQLDSSVLIGHFSPQKFLLVFPDTTADSVTAKMNNLRQKFQSTLQYFDGKAFNSTFSIGVTTYEENKTISDFINTAETDLSQKKNAP